MSAPLVLHLRLDAAPLLAALSGLSELAERSLEVRDGLLGLLDFPKELVSIERDVPTAPSASEVVVVLKPTNRLGVLLSASGAGNV